MKYCIYSAYPGKSVQGFGFWGKCPKNQTPIP